MNNNKRYWIIAGLVALLVLTGYLNYRLNLPDENAPTEEALAPVELPEQAAAIEQPMQIEVDGNPVPQVPAQESMAQSSAGYFTAFRTNRELMRAKEFEVLESIINDANTDSERIGEAQAQKLSLVTCMEQEMIIESLIKAKGFSDAAATIQKGSVNIVVDKETLTDAEAAQIFDIAMRESGEKPENIKVMPKS